jgi:hypothetical protein
MSSSKECCVVIFGYDRPDSLRATILSLLPYIDELSLNVTIHLDGSKGSEDVERVEVCRDIAREFSVEHGYQIILQAENIGLKRSVMECMDRLFELYERVIVCEDDLIFHPSYLQFLIESLDKYEYDSSIYQVTGYAVENYSKGVIFPRVVDFSSSWGWGTWRDRWRNFRLADVSYTDIIVKKEHRRDFNVGDSFPFDIILTRMILGSVHSWAIEWYAFIWSRKGLIICPSDNLVLNRGFDGKGTSRKILFNRVSPVSENISQEILMVELITRSLSVLDGRSALRKLNRGVFNKWKLILQRIFYTYKLR